MKVEDLRPKGAGWQLRLHEKGGKHQRCRAIMHSRGLRAYIDAAGIAEDRKGYLFRTRRGTPRPCSSKSPWRRPMPGA